MLRSKRARKITALSCVALFILLLGMVAGFFIAKYVGTEYLTTCYEGRPPGNEISKTGLPDGYQRGMPLNVSNLRQLPAPGTPEAKDLLASEDTDASTLSLYQLSTDAEIITEQLTEAFLSQLQVQLSAQASGDTSSPNIFSRSLVPPGTNLTQVLEIFKGVARDILNYFRYHRSEALLPLLRQFSLRGGLAFADVDPDVLRSEIQQLINEGTMNEWYASVNRYDNPAIKTEPPGSSGTLSDQANPAQLLMGSPAAAAGGRRLLHSVSLPQQQQQHSRGLQAAASIPALTDSAAVADDTIPTVGPLLSLQDMLCLIKPFNPTGLKGLELPGSGGAITCDVNLPATTYRDGGFVFKPVVIPVVFHCQRYLEGDVLQPPIWEPQTSAQNLIDVTNKLYQGTGIQFALQEVRYDVDKYPYLLLATLNDWQSCTGIPTQESAGFPCIKDTVNFPDVAALAEKLVVNVIVGGSQTAPFCNGTASEVCNSLYLGYCGAMGPWFARPSPTWREGLSEENWIWLTWDMFAPSVRNAYRFWNGGAVTLAHELGHYLGLMHTHEGSTPCEGDGLTKADSVPDTPVNLQTEQWAAQKGLVVQLARWCSEFRNSRSPNPKDLLVFNSCQQDNTVDNVFNLLSYTPDACCMIMSPNQVARLQWATTRFRPKMMAQFAAR